MVQISVFANRVGGKCNDMGGSMNASGCPYDNYWGGNFCYGLFQTESS